MMNSSIYLTTLLKQAKQASNRPLSNPDCPTRAELFDYVYGDLSAAAHQKIAEHNRVCARCHRIAIQIEVDRTEWELRMEKAPDQALSDALGLEATSTMQAIRQKLTACRPSLSRIKDHLMAWLSPPWIPLLAGETVTAHDVAEQTRKFEMDYGEYVNLSCFWQGQDIERTPYIQLTWSANIIKPSRLWARFIDPDTRALLSEFCLGAELEGRKRFERAELGFDPSTTKWAIAIAVETL